MVTQIYFKLGNLLCELFNIKATPEEAKEIAYLIKKSFDDCYTWYFETQLLGIEELPNNKKLWEANLLKMKSDFNPIAEQYNRSHERLTNLLKVVKQQKITLPKNYYSQGNKFYKLSPKLYGSTEVKTIDLYSLVDEEKKKRFTELFQLIYMKLAHSKSYEEKFQSKAYAMISEVFDELYSEVIDISCSKVRELNNEIQSIYKQFQDLYNSSIKLEINTSDNFDQINKLMPLVREDHSNSTTGPWYNFFLNKPENTKNEGSPHLQEKSHTI
ncbi:MAG: hypothetical protein H0U71_03610 [Gammaproteobacteria bacterium]|nr:hypothetical protein [Gammaproteobacteria bacterium]